MISLQQCHERLDAAHARDLVLNLGILAREHRERCCRFGADLVIDLTSCGRTSCRC